MGLLRVYRTMTDPEFVTPDGRPVPAVTADEMREVDRVAVEEVDLSLLQMMENAGRALARTTRELLGETTGTTDPRERAESVTVLAGSGGNGGGGLCAARHLANTGVDVRVILDRDPADLDGAAARQFRILEATDVTLPPAVSAVRSELDDTALAVDALVGYGLDGPVGGRAATLVEACNRAEAPVLSLDVPSGVDATTGERPGPAVDPTRTLTLALPKTGLAGCEDLLLGDIGVPTGVYERVGVAYDQPFDDRSRIRVRATAPD